MRKTTVPIAAALLLAGACGQPGNLPYEIPPIPEKRIYYTDEQGREQYRKIDIFCYVDVSKYNPLNAADYTLEHSGIPFFDYVIIGDAYIERDFRGMYLLMPEDVRRFLEQRNTWLRPLQEKGVKVLLRVTGNESISFGNLNQEEARAYADVIYNALTLYRLDGVDFDDTAADPFIYPDRWEYDPGNSDGKTEAEWRFEQWRKGGDGLSNVAYYLDILGFRPETVITPRQRLILTMQAKNYANYMPLMVQCTEAIADFITTPSVLKCVFNPLREEFPHEFTVYNLQSGGRSPIADEKYGPLVIDLDRGPGQDNVYFYSNGQSAYQSIIKFKESMHTAIFYNGLKAGFEAWDDDFYNWPSFNPNSPETDFLDGNGDINTNPRKIPLLFMMDELAKQLFNEHVVCPERGGNYQKEW
jgi:hypothetical protein